MERSKAAKDKAALVTVKARGVAETSKKAIDIARRQRKCKDVTTRATEKALRTFRYCWCTAGRLVLVLCYCYDNI